MSDAATRLRRELAAKGYTLFEPSGQDGRRCQWLAALDQAERVGCWSRGLLSVDDLEDGMLSWLRQHAADEVIVEEAPSCSSSLSSTTTATTSSSPHAAKAAAAPTPGDGRCPWRARHYADGKPRPLCRGVLHGVLAAALAVAVAPAAAYVSPGLALGLSGKAATYAASAAFHLYPWRTPRGVTAAFVVDLLCVPCSACGAVAPFVPASPHVIAREASVAAGVLLLNALCVRVQTRGQRSLATPPGRSELPRSLLLAGYGTWVSVWIGLRAGFGSGWWVAMVALSLMMGAHPSFQQRLNVDATSQRVFTSIRQLLLVACALATALILLELALLLRFAMGVQAFHAGISRGNWRLSGCCGLCRCSCARHPCSTRITPRRLEQRVGFLTRRFAPHAPRWQLVVWCRNLTLVAVATVSHYSEAEGGWQLIHDCAAAFDGGR